MTTSTSQIGGSGDKIYILDTNVLLDDPESIFAFKDNAVIVPIVDIDEADKFKKDMNETGRNARETFRLIDNFRKVGLAISKGVNLPEGGFFKVEINNNKDLGDTPLSQLDLTLNDNRILLVAYNISQKELKESSNPRRVVIVSNDTSLRIKAEAVDIIAEEYKANFVDFNTLYTGRGSELEIISGSVMDQLGKNFSAEHFIKGALPNQFFTVQHDDDQPFQVRYFNGKIHALHQFKNGSAYDLEARNDEQNCYFDLLLNDSIGMVTAIGKAGTGKTLLAIAAGLQKINQGKYSRLVVTRPICSVGKDLGYLPGDLKSKTDPWMQPIIDAVDFLTVDYVGRDSSEDSRSHGMETPYELMLRERILDVRPLTYLRGATLPKIYFVVDEAQNLSPHEVKTIATRVGDKAKIILVGDPHQIDNPYLSLDGNGLTHFIHKIMGQPLFGHMTLEKGERSEIATICSELL